MTSSTTRTCGKVGTSTRRCGRSGRATPSSGLTSSRPCKGRATPRPRVEGTSRQGVSPWLFSTLKSRNPLDRFQSLKEQFRGRTVLHQVPVEAPLVTSSCIIVPNRPDFYDSYRITSCFKQDYSGFRIPLKAKLQAGPYDTRFTISRDHTAAHTWVPYFF